MAMTIDPMERETRAMHELVDFRGKDVLEIGCGDGRVTERYGDNAATVVAIDPDVATLGAARENLPEALRPKVSFRLADVSSVDLSDASFDVAVFSGSL